MSFLSKLFGGGSAQKPEAEQVIYKDFRIFAEPISESGGFRVAARIEKEVGGETLSHELIRADVCRSETQAREISAAKARQVIDEQGDGLFR